MGLTYYLLPLLLAYVIFRAISHYRAGRKHFFIATVFIACILLFEIIKSIIDAL